MQFIWHYVNIKNVNDGIILKIIRYDSIKLNKQLGLELVWEDKKEQKLRDLDAPPRFYVGDFKDFLSG